MNRQQAELTRTGYNPPRAAPDSLPAGTAGGGYEVAGRWPILALSALTFLLTMPLFAPWSWWPLAYVAFVPWLAAVCAARRAGWMYFVSYLLGAAFFFYQWRWVYSTTPEGYIAGVLAQLAPFFPLAAWPIRHLYRTRRLGVMWSFPIVWVAVEMYRSYNPLAFPWFFLGHTQIRLLTMVQIADVTGVFGITFLVAMVNGWFTDLLISRILPARARMSFTPRKLLPGAVVVASLLAGTVAYGCYRLAQHRLNAGPMIGVLQGDYLLKPISDATDPSDAEKRHTYLMLMKEAVDKAPDVDLLVVPESPWSMYLNREFREHRPEFKFWHETFLRLVARYGKPILTGALSNEPMPPGTYPKEKRYNSAFFYRPGVAEPDRYDKIHLVPFSEQMPFRFNKHLHWLYRFLNDGPWNPWGGKDFEHSLIPGTEFTVFELTPPSSPETKSRFGVTICYEDVIPQVFRRFVSGRDGHRRADFMLNISNDGWFRHGAQQGQHLVNCAFRAIENRVGVARAVNTGISGFIDADGSWHNLLVGEGGGLSAGGTGFSVARADVQQGVTFYSQYGDVFGLAVADAFVTGRGRRRARKAARKQAAEKKDRGKARAGREAKT